LPSAMQIALREVFHAASGWAFRKVRLAQRQIHPQNYLLHPCSPPRKFSYVLIALDLAPAGPLGERSLPASLMPHRLAQVTAPPYPPRVRGLLLLLKHRAACRNRAEVNRNTARRSRNRAEGRNRNSSLSYKRDYNETIFKKTLKIFV
jgi:hypothetical protein